MSKGVDELFWLFDLQIRVSYMSNQKRDLRYNLHLQSDK